MRFRVRRYGDSEWTLITLAGELQDFLAGSVGASLNKKFLHVQIEVDGEWEDM